MEQVLYQMVWCIDPQAKRFCPKTVQLIQDNPQIHLAMFSILKPGAVITPHTGAFRGAMRYHLGLKTPGENCRIYVDGKPYSWKDGEGVLFDDTYIHSVKNEEDSPRIVLFLDVERPTSGLGRIINSFVCKNIAGRTTGRDNPNQKKS